MFKLYIIFYFLFLFLFNTFNIFANDLINKRKEQILTQETFFNIKNVFNKDKIKTLEDYINIGLANNASVKSAFYKWKSAFYNISKEFSLPNPQFTYTKYRKEVETRVGPQKHAYSIKQRIPLFDKIWIKKHKAFKIQETAYYNFKSKQKKLIYDISDIYYECIYLTKAVLLTKESLKLLINFEKTVQIRYQSSAVNNQDLLKVQVELGKLENTLKSLEELKIPLMIRLKSLLNVSDDNIMSFPKYIDDTGLDKKYTESKKMFNILNINNPDILGLKEKINQNKDLLKLAKRKLIPDLTIGVTHIETDDALNPATIDNGKDPLLLTFSVELPIWFTGINAGISAARAKVKSAENQRLNKENELISKIAVTNYKLKDSFRQSKLYKDILIPKSLQALNSIKSGYESGKNDFLSLIDAQRFLLEFQLAYYRYTINFHQRFAELCKYL